MKLKLRLFWCKTISWNVFTPQCVFSCAWKIKFSVKPFQLIVCFVALTQKLVYTFIFTTNHFRTHQTRRKRERERGKKLAHSTLIHPHRSMHRRDRATNPPTDRPTLSIDEIAPRTHELIDPPSEWPTPRSTHLVHWRVAPTNRSFSVPLSQYRSCDFDFCFLCCLYILFLCNNICLDPKKMWETW